jgi:hypothetical protein
MVNQPQLNRCEFPQLQVTHYEVSVAALLTAVCILVVSLATMVTVWVSNLLVTELARPVGPDIAQTMILKPDGAATYVVTAIESPESTADDPSAVTNASPVANISHIIATVALAADEAADIPAESTAPSQTADVDTKGKGRSGITQGGRINALRETPQNAAEQRWYVRFGATPDLKSYVAMLNELGIELGAMNVERHELVYLRPSVDKKPVTRRVTSGVDEKRLFMNWQGGTLREMDNQLFQQAGIDASNHTMVHFYSAEAEQKLRQLELDYAGKPAEAIRKTHFLVRMSESGVQIKVTNQQLR